MHVQRSPRAQVRHGQQDRRGTVGAVLEPAPLTRGDMAGIESTQRGLAAVGDHGHLAFHHDVELCVERRVPAGKQVRQAEP